jgi:hypothetical protein
VTAAESFLLIGYLLIVAGLAGITSTVAGVLTRVFDDRVR